MAVELDYMEYANNAAAQAAYVTSAAEGYGSDILTGGTPSADSVETGYPASQGCDDNAATRWISTDTAFPHWWKYDLGVGTTKTVRKVTIYPHPGGGGIRFKDFKVQGSNNDSDWTDIYTGQHTDAEAKETFTFANATAYRYYRIYVTTTWDGWSDYCDVKEIEMMEMETILQCYSEDTIKEQGSYSLKGIALITESLNDTLTRTVDPVIDLSGIDKVVFDIRASRTGSNIKIGIHDSGGTTTEITPNVASANTWQNVEWDISGVADADKDAIDSIIITIVNADADNTFYIDNMYGVEEAGNVILLGANF